MNRARGPGGVGRRITKETKEERVSLDENEIAR